MSTHNYIANQRGAIALLFFCTMAYKFALDVAYVLYRQWMPFRYADISNGKYALSLTWCIVFFFLIRHSNRLSSSFFLYLIYAFQIIPISTVYAMDNEDSVYYFSVCGSFALCVFLVNFVRDPDFYVRSETVSRIMIPAFIALVLLLMVDIIARNGMPRSMFLAFSDVYELRRSGWFQTGKFFSYILDYARQVFIPACITTFIIKRKYLYAFSFVGIMILLYLYNGLKSLFFGAILVALSAFCSRRKNSYYEVFIGISCFFVLLIIGFYLFAWRGGFFYKGYLLIIDRCLFTPAKLKFQYYDFFKTNPRLGFYSILPSWLVPAENPYPYMPITNLIAMRYYNKPLMSANTGFLAEGYSHFGHIGTVLELVTLAVILKQMDYFQRRTSYSTTIGFFTYAFYTLIDGPLFTSLGFGTWMLIVLILIFYQNPVGSERSG